MGLNHPVDIAAYRRAEEANRSFRRIRALRRRFRADGETPRLYLSIPDGEPRVVLAFDSRARSSRLAVLELVGLLGPGETAVLSPFPLDGPGSPFPSGSHRVVEVGTVDDAIAVLGDARVGVSAGAHVPAGALVHDWMTRIAGSSIVVQHGMLLPQVAPLPTGALLAAWSSADGAFWRSGRDDITVEVVGSELLHQAARADVVPVVEGSPPVFCGALHGTELPRRTIERVSRDFCRATGARYRPHPAETDVQSRLTHRLWKALGIEITSSTVPLLGVGAPVVGIWSTAVLEAATAGLPAWVHHPDPPGWLIEVWDRYGLSRWGDDPTPISPLAAGEPARRTAELVASRIG